MYSIQEMLFPRKGNNNYIYIYYIYVVVQFLLWNNLFLNWDKRVLDCG